MTKNSDVSWIPKPAGCSLKRFTTAELAAELATRDGVDCDSVKSMWEYRIEKEPPEEEEDPNIYNSWDVSWAIDAIENEISSLWAEYAKTGIIRLDACARKLEWVLSLLKPENK